MVDAVSFRSFNKKAAHFMSRLFIFQVSENMMQAGLNAFNYGAAIN